MVVVVVMVVVLVVVVVVVVVMVVVGVVVFVVVIIVFVVGPSFSLAPSPLLLAGVGGKSLTSLLNPSFVPSKSKI